MARISILGINYAPENTGIGPYTTELAEHLARNHLVTVFAGTPHYPNWAVDSEWRSGRRPSTVSKPNLEVIHYRHYVPKKQDALRRIAYEATWAVQSGIGASRRSADVIVAIVPALLGAGVARIAGRIQKAPVGFIVQDVMSAAAAQSGISGGRTVAGAAELLERKILKSADRIVTIHNRLADSMQKALGLDVLPDVVPNWSHVRTAPQVETERMRRQLGWGNETVVLHSGNMGLKQNLSAVLDAADVAMALGIDVRFVLAGGGSQYGSLYQHASTRANVDVMGSVSDADFPAFLGAADILLVNERRGMQDMSLPSKLTSYFAARRPVIAAVDRSSATGEMLTSAQAALLCAAGEPKMLVDAIVKIRSDSELAAALVRQAARFSDLNFRRSAGLEAHERWILGLVGRQ